MSARQRSTLLAIAITLLLPLMAEARITQFIVTSRESPTFEGISFGAVGQYERIVGIAKGELNPDDPLNAGIVDIGKAPRNARGMVEYDVDIFILKPVDLSKGNGRIFYDVLNRGNKLAVGFFNSGYFAGLGHGSIRSNDPRLAGDAGNGFLMRYGYTVVWSGWQPGYPFSGGDASGSRIDAGSGRMSGRFPVATNSDGSPIVGLSREEFIVGSNASPFVVNLTYPAANLNPANATLTVREKQADARQSPAGMSWKYVDEWRVQITRPSSPAFDGGAIYEFIYPAKDPNVAGIGLASLRDVNSFLRYHVMDDARDPNPLAPGGKLAIERAMIYGASQSGRFLRDYIYQGFNQDEAGRIVFDGAMPDISGSRRNWINFRFAQSGRFSRQHEDHFQRGDQFPFTYGTLHDHISGLTDGILAKCHAARASADRSPAKGKRLSSTCPLIMHTDTNSEVWQGRASLVVTDTKGRDIKLPSDVRAYLFDSSQHVWLGGVPSRGICQQLSNPMDYQPVRRALLLALDEWVTDGRKPPASRFPKRSDGTLVRSDQASTEFPGIPGVTYNGLFNWLRLTNYEVHPPFEGDFYPVFVTKSDGAGNGLSGVRPPHVEAPLATHTGWNTRAAGQAQNELCATTGSYIPFARTRAERLAAGDPRLSVEERYGSQEGYLCALRAAATKGVKQRFLLQEDADRIVAEAAASNILQSDPNSSIAKRLCKKPDRDDDHDEREDDDDGERDD
jgi:hypothetical protein